MNKSQKALYLLAVLGFFLLEGTSLRAAIVIDASFQGTVIVTAPDGEIKVIQAGESIPNIAKDSTVEVFNGNISLNLGPEDGVTVSCGKQSAGVGGGGSVTVTCGETDGKLKVQKGPVHFSGQGAAQTLLEEGKEYPFGKAGDSEKKAPPTAEVEDTTGTPLAGDPPVDSRSIQASQSQ